MTDEDDDNDLSPLEFVELFSESKIGEATEYVSLLFNREYKPDVDMSVKAIRIVVRSLRKVADELEQQVVSIENGEVELGDIHMFLEDEEDDEDE